MFISIPHFPILCGVCVCMEYLCVHVLSKRLHMYICMCALVRNHSFCVFISEELYKFVSLFGKIYMNFTVRPLRHKTRNVLLFSQYLNH